MVGMKVESEKSRLKEELDELKSAYKALRDSAFEDLANLADRIDMLSVEIYESGNWRD